MSTPFEPVGEVARWRTLVVAFCTVPRGAVLTFGQLADPLDLDPVTDRRAIQAAVRHASIALSRDHARSLVPVRGVGYRVALPDEHVDLAGQQQRKSRHALVRARRHVDHVDLGALSEVSRHLVFAAVSALAYQQAQIRSIDLQQKDMELAVESITTRVDRTDAEIAARREDLQRQIAALEANR